MPPFRDTVNANLFGQYFGIEFHIDDRSYVQPISAFEFTRTFSLIDDLTYKLSKPEHVFSADAVVPVRTSICL